MGKRAKNGGGWEDEGDSECWGGVVDVAVLLNFNEHQGEFILHIFFSSHSVFSLPLAAPIF